MPPLMDQVSLSAQTRAASGSRAARRLRSEGLVPAVVYGRGQDPVTVTVSQRELYAALHTEAGLNALIELDLGGDSMLTVAREVQRHPVRGEITHLDFITIDLSRPIEAEVGIEYVGNPVGVRDEGGIVETIEVTVSIEALPTQIPSSIAVDIDSLHLGDTLTLSELPEIEGVTYLDEPDRPLLTVVAPRAEVEEVPEGLEELEEGEEPAEGADEEAAEAADDSGDEG